MSSSKSRSAGGDRNLPDTLQRAIAGLQQVNAMHPLKEFLRAKKLKSARGWPDSVERLLEHINGNQLALSDFMDFYEETRLLCHKSVGLFQTTTRFRHLVADLRPSRKNDFALHYPVPLNEETLSQITRTPQLAAKRQAIGGVLLVFCSPQFYEERVEVTPEMLRESAPHKIRKATEITAKLRHWYQAYDTVYVGDDGRMHIRIDCPPNSRSNVAARMGDVESALRELIGQDCGFQKR